MSAATGERTTSSIRISIASLDMEETDITIASISVCLLKQEITVKRGLDLSPANRKDSYFAGNKKVVIYVSTSGTICGSSDEIGIKLDVNVDSEICEAKEIVPNEICEEESPGALAIAAASLLYIVPSVEDM